MFWSSIKEKYVNFLKILFSYISFEFLVKFTILVVNTINILALLLLFNIFI